MSDFKSYRERIDEINKREDQNALLYDRDENDGYQHPSREFLAQHGITKPISMDEREQEAYKDTVNDGLKRSDADHAKNLGKTPAERYLANHQERMKNDPQYREAHMDENTQENQKSNDRER